ncbi:hypothetical protein [Mycetohabitans rhizoxinica]
MDFDLHAALNDYQAYMCALESCPQAAASAPPPTLKPASGALANPLASRPTTYHDLPPELIQQIGDYVPVQDVGNFSAVDRRTYHAMHSRRVVYRYWQRANQAVSLASVNQLLKEMDGTLADPAQHVEPIEALRRRLEALPYRERGEAFKRMYAAAQRNSTSLTRWRSGVRPRRGMSGRNSLTVWSYCCLAQLSLSSVIRRSWLGLGP